MIRLAPSLLRIAAVQRTVVMAAAGVRREHPPLLSADHTLFRGHLRQYHHGRKFEKYLRALHALRQQVGPDKPQKRADQRNFNMDAELNCFAVRLGESVPLEVLVGVFTDPSQARSSDQLEDSLELVDTDRTNEELAKLGHSVASEYLSTVLRHHYPQLPEECVLSTTQHLLSLSVLSHVSQQLGTEDLILADVWPVKEEHLAQALLAWIGALAREDSPEVAGRFTHDFLLPQLLGRDINTLWTIRNPGSLLTRLLMSRGEQEPVARLVWSTGVSTVMAAYQVALFSGEQVVGLGFGETSVTAEEEACHDGLRRVFGTGFNSSPIPFGAAVGDLQLDFSRRNKTFDELAGGSSETPFETAAQ